MSFLAVNIDLLADDISETKFNIVLNVLMNDENTPIGKIVRFRQEQFVQPKGKHDPKITSAKAAQKQMRTEWQKLQEYENRLGGTKWLED